MTTDTAGGADTAGSPRRWLQLILGLIVMMAISSPQYVWTLFTGPLGTATGSSLAEVQVTFSILVVLQTWAAPGQGWLIDRFGPRLLVALGAALSGMGWVLASTVSSLTALYLTYGLFCGIGTGFVYIGVVGLMVRWFPAMRGFAVGVVAAGYGFGALATTFPIDTMIKTSRAIASTLLVTFGVILGIGRRRSRACCCCGCRERAKCAPSRRTARPALPPP